MGSGRGHASTLTHLTPKIAFSFWLRPCLHHDSQQRHASAVGLVGSQPRGPLSQPVQTPSAEGSQPRGPLSQPFLMPSAAAGSQPGGPLSQPVLTPATTLALGNMHACGG